MAETEQLREALIELKSLRESEARTLLETNALLGSLEMMTAATSRRDAISALLAVVAETLNCELIGVLQTQDELVFVQASIERIEGVAWPFDPHWLRKKRRVVELRKVPIIAEVLPPALEKYHGLLSVPLDLSNGDKAFLVCFSTTPDHFTGQDEHLLTRFGALASQAISTLALENERARMRKLLDQAERQVSLFQVVAGLAHDFNNLLSTITGSASLITSDVDAISAHTDAERISIAGQRAAELVNKFLEVSAPEQMNELVDLRLLLQESVDLAGSSMRASSTLTADFGAETVYVHTNQTDVLQVVLNLIVNAQDALGSDGGEIKVSLQQEYEIPAGPCFQHGKFHPDRSYVAIVVEDTGTGIPPDKLEGIFTPYMTTKGKDGTGLGLSIVASIVSANKGVICLCSTESLGTIFAIYWPIGAETQALPEISTENISLKNIPILMVDDQIGVARVHASILEREGAEVASCTDPNIALEAIIEDPDAWGCLITDYDMPDMNGGELIEKVRGIAPNLPIILVTAHSKSLNDPRVTRDSVDRILAKPVNAKTLVNAVSVALAKGER